MMLPQECATFLTTSKLVRLLHHCLADRFAELSLKILATIMQRPYLSFVDIYSGPLREVCTYVYSYVYTSEVDFFHNCTETVPGNSVTLRKDFKHNDRTCVNFWHCICMSVCFDHYTLDISEKR